jgi:hypothetical protein
MISEGTEVLMPRTKGSWVTMVVFMVDVGKGNMVVTMTEKD